MPQSFVAQDEVKAIVRTVLMPLLKKHGYRKVSYTWRKTEGELVKVLNLQTSQFNDRHQASFTINLGIHHPQYHALRELPSIRASIKEYDCEIRQRIGQLMGSCDYWWTVASDKDNAETSDDLSYKVERYALPWLDSFHSLHDMLQFFVGHGMSFDAAVASHLLGRPNVREHLDAARTTANPYFRRTVDSWAARHGYTAG